MIVVILLLTFGISLSALFSGSEMGFYRVTRLRLVMDGLRGDTVAKRLLWLTNNPSLFVATTLVGNNIANYLTSLAIVMGCQLLLDQSTVFVEIIAPILLAPVLFIYGESLPKSLFMKVPNFLLRKTGLLFMLFFGLLIPASSLLWLVGRGLERLVGASPVKVRLALARQELDEILQEGQDAGILQKGQRQLANSMFSTVNHPIKEYVQPLTRFQMRATNPSRDQLLDFAKRSKVGVVVVIDRQGSLRYHDVAELLVSNGNDRPEGSPIIELRDQELMGTVLVRMQSEKQSIARILDQHRRPSGYVTVSNLSNRLVTWS